MLCSREMRVSVETTPGDGLQLIVEQIHELLVIAGIELKKHGVGTSGEMALHDFGDVEQTLHHLLVHVASLEVDTDIGAGGITQALGVDIETAAGDVTILHQVLHTLMNGCTRHTTLCCYVLEGMRAFLDKMPRIFSVKIINFIHSLCF